MQMPRKVPVFAPDTMKFVRLIAKERDYETDVGRILGPNQKIVVLLSVLIETKKVQDRKMENVLLSICWNKEEPDLSMYSDDSKIIEFANEVSKMNQEKLPTLTTIKKAEEEIKRQVTGILNFLESCNAEIFPDPLRSDCAPLSSLTRNKEDLGLYLNNLRTGVERISGKHVKMATIKKYKLEAYEVRVKGLVVRAKLRWKKYKHDSHLLTLYLKAKEIWSDLEIVTEERALKRLGKKVSEFRIRSNFP